MGAGKSLHLLQTAHNLENAGKKCYLFKPAIDTRNEGVIRTRLGIERKCGLLHDNVLDHIKDVEEGSIILIDEAQFLSEKNVVDLCSIVDYKNVNVYCYGLRSSVTGDLFEGSRALFVFADKLIQLSNVSDDGRKAIMHAKKDKNGVYLPYDKLTTVEVGDDTLYDSISRKQWLERYGKIF